jgi:hypothetical protein
LSLSEHWLLVHLATANEPKLATATEG